MCRVSLTLGDVSRQNLEWGRYCPSDCFHVSKFQAPDCLHYNARRRHGKKAHNLPKHSISSTNIMSVATDPSPRVCGEAASFAPTKPSGSTIPLLAEPRFRYLVLFPRYHFIMAENHTFSQTVSIRRSRWKWTFQNLWSIWRQKPSVIVASRDIILYLIRPSKLCILQTRMNDTTRHYCSGANTHLRSVDDNSSPFRVVDASTFIGVVITAGKCHARHRLLQHNKQTDWQRRPRRLQQQRPMLRAFRDHFSNTSLYGRPMEYDRPLCFCPVVSFFFFFPRLISAAADCMSTILLHMVWP